MQTRLSGFLDQNLGCDGDWVEGLDGMDSEDFFFLLPISKRSFLTTGWGFGLSLPLLLFCPSFTSHCEPEDLELISADVPALLGEGETTVCLC